MPVPVEAKYVIEQLDHTKLRVYKATITQFLFALAQLPALDNKVLQITEACLIRPKHTQLHHQVE